MSGQYKYTLFGVIAILLWSSVAGLVRQVAEAMSPVGGAACVYTLASLFLFVVVGVPKWRSLSWRYLLIGGVMFAGYEILISLALGMANTRLQAIEVSVINYLWPALTILFAVILSANKTSRWIYPSVAVAFCGVVWAVGGREVLSLTHLSQHLARQPSIYIMALVGAVLWAVYCILTKNQPQDQNAITLFFMLTALVLWVQYALSPEPALHLSWHSAVYLLLAALVMAGGYGLWIIAIMGGNMVLLATLSYFTPIFSTLLSSLLLSVILPGTFWVGVALVTLGSMLCWWATTHRQSPQPVAPKPADKECA